MTPTAPSPTSYRQDPKRAAVDQWTADPCGPAVGGSPGSRDYFDDLLRGRTEYAPWMAEELDYAGAHGLDVLDVGCGQGIDLARYALAGARPTGVDLTPRHVELASAHLESMGLAVTVLVADAESLPFPDDTFDRVSSNGVLHHTSDMPAALQEIHRVLRPGGVVRIIVYNRHSFHYLLSQFLTHGLLTGKLFRERSMTGVLSTTVERTSVGARPLVRVYSPRQVREMLEQAGFEAVTARPRHFRASDTPITRLLAPRVPALRDPRVLDRLGRLGGWYVVGTGRAASPASRNGHEETAWGFRKRLSYAAAVIEERRARTVLDVGCGTGTFLTAPLAEQFPSVTFVGTDSDERSLAEGKIRHSHDNLTFVASGKESEGPYDVVIASEVLEHVEDPPGFLAYLRSRLAPDGRILLTVPNGRGPFEAVTALEGLLVMSGVHRLLGGLKRWLRLGSPPSETGTLATSPHLNFFTLRSLRCLVGAVGLEVEELRARTLLTGFVLATLIRGERLVRLNARVADRVPLAVASGWLLVLRETPGRPLGHVPYRRSRVERLQARLARTRIGGVATKSMGTLRG